MRLVIGEDQVSFRNELVRLIEDEGHEVVGTAGDGIGLVREAIAHQPEVVIADVRMPPSHTDDGLRASLEIRAAEPDMGILVLSHHVQMRYVRELFRAGAGGLGYLLKQRLADLSRFFDALQRIGSGGSVIDPELVSIMLSRQGPIGTLTAQQLEALSLMAEGCTDAEIASELETTEVAVAELTAGIFDLLGLAPANGPHRVPTLIRYLNR